MFKLDVSLLHFETPQYLWLLAAPAFLLPLWIWRVARYRACARGFRARRLPVREQMPLAGGLMFWLSAVLALASVVLALARPVTRVSLLRTAGVDLVILQDGSASMRVPDVAPDRWQRSMRFMRVVGESLRWKNDRVAMALFAHIAAPEIRLTSDPNTFFFFLDHLDHESPFPQEDETTWDTNIELGIYWGVRVVEKDEELNHKSPNAKVFLLVSDGQAWSGETANAIALARNRGIPIFVVGVGTSTGGIIPQPQKPPRPGTTPPPTEPIRAALDRESLSKIATEGGGAYFELDRQGDRDIANAIIDAARRRAGSLGVEEGTEGLYWQCLAAAAIFLGLGLLFLRERTELWLHALAAVAALASVWVMTR